MPIRHWVLLSVLGQSAHTCTYTHTHTHTPCIYHPRPRASVLQPHSTEEANMKLDSGVRQLLFSCLVMSDSLQPNRLQLARLPCPSLSPRICSNLCPLNWWCHPTISSSVTFFSCPQSFPASGSFPVSWLFASDSQSIEASASVLPINIGLIFFRIDSFDLLAVQGTL